MIKAICPRCKKVSDLGDDQAPKLARREIHCGDCLMTATEVTDLYDARLTHFLAIGPGVWGRATTEAQAIKNMQRLNGGAVTIYTVHRAVEAAEVNEGGGINQPKGNPAPVRIKEVGFKK